MMNFTESTLAGRGRRSVALTLLGLLALLGWGAPAQAQLLPGGGLGLPGLSGGLSRLQSVRPLESLSAAVPLQELRQRTVRELLRDHGDVIEADPAGAPVRRAELILVSPAQASVDAAVALGFRVLREQTLEGLDLRSVVLQPPRGMATTEGADRLRALDPRLEIDFNHVYTRSGSQAQGSAAAAPARVCLQHATS